MGNNLKNNLPDQNCQELGQESGFVLILSLVLLVLLTIFSISTMDTGTLEQKMVSNTQFTVDTFNTAEQLVVKGENYIRDSITVTFPTFRANNSGLFDDIITDVDFLLPGYSNVTITHQGSDVVVSLNPHPEPEEGCDLDETGCMDYYSVTAVGTNSAGTQQTIETLYGKHVKYQP